MSTSTISHFGLLTYVVECGKINRMRLLDIMKQTKKAIVDDEHYIRCSRYNWSLIYKHIYAWRNKKHVPLPNFIMRDYINRYDHIDNDPWNNLESNLRIATNSQNLVNVPKKDDCTSTYKGVVKCPDDIFRVYGKKNYKTYYLGSFKDEITAAHAYDRWARIMHGEFAKLNFPGVQK